MGDLEKVCDNRWKMVGSGMKGFLQGRVTAMNTGYSKEKGLGEIRGTVRETS